MNNIYRVSYAEKLTHSQYLHTLLTNLLRQYFLENFFCLQATIHEDTIHVKYFMYNIE